MVSIIIPVYNRGDLLEKTLSSIKFQEGIDFEIIVVDDNSTEENIENITNKYGALYLKNIGNLGAQKSRNKGVEFSKYEYIAFLDSDDLWVSQNKLLLQYNILNERKDISIVFTTLEYIDGLGNITSRQEDQCDIDFNNFIRKILRKDIIGTYSSVMMRKKDFMKAGMCNTDLPARQDWDLWIRLSILGNAYKLADCITQYRIHENQISSAYSKKIDGFAQLLINHKKLFFSNGEMKSYHIHLFKLVLLSVLRNATSSNYEKLFLDNYFASQSMKTIAFIIKNLLPIPDRKSVV